MLVALIFIYSFLRYAAISISENEDGKLIIKCFCEFFFFFSLSSIQIYFIFSGLLNEVKEMKGLDIVRRDWCDLAKDAGK